VVLDGERDGGAPYGPAIAASRKFRQRPASRGSAAYGMASLAKGAPALPIGRTPISHWNPLHPEDAYKSGFSLTAKLSV
jgi:hypothetical protein